MSVVTEECMNAAMTAFYQSKSGFVTSMRAALAAVIPAIQNAALERAAALQECGCTLRTEVVKAAADHGPNSAARWNLCGCSNCGALDAAAIRALKEGT
jgi:hypothetical protein